MKKFLVAILATLYLGTSVGATVHMHYCMGKIAGWGFGVSEAKACGKCGMEQSVQNDNNCCRDENKFIQNNTDQKVVGCAFQVAQPWPVAVPAPYIELPGLTYFSLSWEKYGSHSPPNASTIPVYIRNCVFRI